MVEARGLPRDRGVAGLASLGEAAGDMVRVGGSLEVLQMAGNAGRGREVVVVVDVAVQADARRIGVRVGQSKSNRGVVKRCGLPGNGGVACLASLGEAAGNMVRVGGSLEVFQMAGNAGRDREVVVVVDVAVQADARRIGVRVGQGESDS